MSTILEGAPHSGRKVSDPGVQPAGPRGLPLLGNGLQLARDPLGFVLDLGRNYGVVSTATFGVYRMYMVNEPELIEEVLLGKHKDCIKDKTTRDLAPLVGNGLLTSEGEFWRRQRKLASAPLQPKRIESYAATVIDCCTRYISEVREGETRDVHEDMMHLTLEIVSKTLLGVDARKDADRVGEVMVAFLNYFELQMYSWQGFVPLAIPTPARWRMRRAIADLDKLIYEMIARCRAAGPGADNLLSRLVHSRDDDGQAMSDAQLRDEAVTMLLAGHETTALVLSYAVYALSQHPEHAARVRAEVGALLDAPGADPSALCKLPHLDAFIRETMRLYPPAYAIGREVVRPFTLAGYEFAAGSQLVFSPYTMQRDPRFFPNPEQFRPERWLEERETPLPRFAYFPFGGGPRVCIGMHFAMMEIAIVLGMVAHRLDLQIPAGTPLTLQPVVTLRVEGGIPVRAHRLG